MEYQTIKDIDINGKRLLMRVDFNVPLENGQVASDRRIAAALPTIRYALDHKAAVVLMSHLGRPSGEVEPSLSLKPVAQRLQALLDGPRVRVVDDWSDPDNASPSAGEVVLLENLRFHPGEKDSDDDFSDGLARLADIYVNDAFAACHRQHASTYGVATCFDKAKRAIGLLVQRELEAIDGLLDTADRPFLVVLGGAKVAGKIGVVDRLLQRADHVCIGGQMAYTFLKAAGQGVGESKVEAMHVGFAKQLITLAGERIVLPTDHVIADQTDELAQVERAEGGIPGDWYGLDIGSKTIQSFTKLIGDAQTVVWNGPMGKFEEESFRRGTREIVQALCKTDAQTLVGGGESIQALEQFGDTSVIDHVSTGGGAFLTYLKDRKLPALEAIPQRQPHAEQTS